MYFKKYNPSAGIDSYIEGARSGTIADTFEECLGSLDCEERVSKMNVVIDDILLYSRERIYNEIGAFLKKEKPNILEELNENYLQSIRLQRIWTKLIGASEG
jgi:hypothetical protein